LKQLRRTRRTRRRERERLFFEDVERKAEEGKSKADLAKLFSGRLSNNSTCGH